MTFTLDEIAARAWLTDVIESNEAGDWNYDLHDLNSQWILTSLQSPYLARALVHSAQMEGILTETSDSTVHLHYGSDNDYFLPNGYCLVMVKMASGLTSQVLRLASPTMPYASVVVSGSEPDQLTGADAAIHALHRVTIVGNDMLADLHTWADNRSS